MAVSVDLARKSDKACEDKSLTDILDAPVAGLAGLTERHTAALKDLLNISTVRELGSNKYFATAGVLVALDKHTG